jgi:hypothetical protein
MSVPVENIVVGKCYLVETGRVRRVMRLMPDGRVQFEHRLAQQPHAKSWQPGMQEGRSFAAQVEREVACDWGPESDERDPQGAARPDAG